MVSTEEGIAIAEICVYIPVSILTLIVVFRHGFKRQAGWIYLAIFCGIKIAGAGFRITQTHNPTNKTDIEWAAILESIGLSPLLLATMGFLKRVTDKASYHVRSENNAFSALAAALGIVNSIAKRATASSRRSRIIQIATLPTMIALALAIFGATKEANLNVSDISNGKKLMKAAIIMFLTLGPFSVSRDCMIYIIIFALVVITIKDIGNAPRAEKRIYLAVMGSLPLLAVRILYSILAVFTNNEEFSVFSGNPLVRLFMEVVEEFMIVCFYVSVGLTANEARERQEIQGHRLHSRR
ncbi:hypothetical protein N431DRAFT_525255 [Stipitochalara longipes BDJ]|nr:hypothetical protein N431DRAFT_525255 [Stipitochalara longipes BDJ]